MASDGSRGRGRATDPGRIGAVAVVCATGAVLFGVNASRLAAGPGPAVGVVSGLAGLVSFGVIVAGLLLHLGGLDGDGLARVAGWTVVGVVAFGTVLAPVALAGGGTGGVAGAVLAVAAAAGLLVGVCDARRIQAGTVARTHRRVAAVDRVVQHTLRDVADTLDSAADRTREATDDADALAAAGEVERSAGALRSLTRKAEAVHALAGDGKWRSRVTVGDLLATAAETAREANPDADVRIERPEEGDVEVDARAETAARFLAENAAEHAGPAPTVHLSARVEGDRVVVAVADDGPGIDDRAWDLATADRPVEVPELAGGLGLLASGWSVEACDGTLARAESDLGGALVRIEVPRID